MRQELPRCFTDSAWTIVHPGLRSEIKKRVRSRFPRALAAHADESDVVQDTLDAALHNRGLLKRLSPPQRSSWFWVVVSRLSAHVARRRSKVVAVENMTDDHAREVLDLGAAEPASALVQREQVDAVRAALATLALVQRGKSRVKLYDEAGFDSVLNAQLLHLADQVLGQLGWRERRQHGDESR